LQIVPYQLFATADGWLVLAVGNDGQWQKFCSAAGRDDLATDARYLANADRVRMRGQLVPVIEAIMRGRATADWQAALQDAGVPHAPVWGYRELFNSEQALERGLKVQIRDSAGRPVDLLGSPFRIGGTDLPEWRMPPGLGDDTDAVLSEMLGLDTEKLHQLRRDGVI
jgi:crotonobetainyl-CoA:carnitine CoA-transferase CaiB-like acyl-CoA transferase